MAGNLKYNVYPIVNEAENNDVARPGTLYAELHKVTWTANAVTAVAVELTSVFGKDKCDASDLLGCVILQSGQGASTVLVGASVAQSSSAGMITLTLQTSASSTTVYTKMSVLVFGFSKSESVLTIS